MPKKQSTDELSTLAAAILSGRYKASLPQMMRDVKRLAASVLAQDEQKGRRKK